MFRNISSFKPDSYRGMPSGMPFMPHHQSAFRRCLSDPFPAAFVVVALLMLWFASPPSAPTQTTVPAKPTAELPPGPMQPKATAACTECHEARIILQQRLSKPAWTKEVDKMTKWGAVVDAADRDALIDYLSTNFSPEKPAYEPPRTASDKNPKKK